MNKTQWREKQVVVYISGPMAINIQKQMKRALSYASQLRDFGYTPIIPHLFHFWEMIDGGNYANFITLDVRLLSVCDCLLRMDGVSPGAEAESMVCKKLGIQIYHSMEELLLSQPCEVLPGGDETDSNNGVLCIVKKPLESVEEYVARYVREC